MGSFFVYKQKNKSAISAECPNVPIINGSCCFVSLVSTSAPKVCLEYAPKGETDPKRRISILTFIAHCTLRKGFPKRKGARIFPRSFFLRQLFNSHSRDLTGKIVLGYTRLNVEFYNSKPRKFQPTLTIKSAANLVKND